MRRGRKGFDEAPHEGREILVAAILGGLDQRHLRGVLLAVSEKSVEAKGLRLGKVELDALGFRILCPGG